jgi:hypothetical protein
LIKEEDGTLFPARKAFKPRSVKNIRDPNSKAASNLIRNLNRKSKSKNSIVDVSDRSVLIAKARASRIISDKNIRAARINHVLQDRAYEETLDDVHPTFTSFYIDMERGYESDLDDEYYDDEYYESMNLGRY